MTNGLQGTYTNKYAAITHLLDQTSSSFQSELKKKQLDLDSLHASLRTTSTQLGEARRSYEALQATTKSQFLTRQKIINLTRARDEEHNRVLRLKQAHGPLDESHGDGDAKGGIGGAWEFELNTILEKVAVAATQPSTDGDAANPNPNPSPSPKTIANDLLPATAVLRARVAALRARADATRKNVGALRSLSRDTEVKYRRVVALCTGVPEPEVESVVDNLLRAVESEKGELEIARVRRFLGGVEEGV